MNRGRSVNLREVKRLTACLAAATALSVAGGAAANDEVPHEARGHERSGYALSAYENINLANGNLTFRVPLAPSGPTADSPGSSRCTTTPRCGSPTATAR